MPADRRQRPQRLPTAAEGDLPKRVGEFRELLARAEAAGEGTEGIDGPVALQRPRVPAQARDVAPQAFRRVADALPQAHAAAWYDDRGPRQRATDARHLRALRGSRRPREPAP